MLDVLRQFKGQGEKIKETAIDSGRYRCDFYLPLSLWTDKKKRTNYTAASSNEEAEAGLVFRLLEFPAETIQKAFNMNGKKQFIDGSVLSMIIKFRMSADF